MTKITYSNEFFSPKAVLESGQCFRFTMENGEYFVQSSNKACTIKSDETNIYIECNDEDKDYFYNFFDLQTDYGQIIKEGKNKGEYLNKAMSFGKGLRLLRQDKTECIINFIISQQNNIPRIKGLVNKLCESLGEKRQFKNKEYFTYPSLKVLSSQTEDVFRSMGAGYRSKYILETSKRLFKEGYDKLNSLKGDMLKKELTSYLGIGNKVADCISLFGFRQTTAFPVDTWIEKLYHENYNGETKDRNKINKFFVDKFGPNAGIFQQYLFYYKRENPDFKI